MDTRKKVCVAAVGLAAAVLLVTVPTRSRQPQYGGKPLSHWVQAYGVSYRAGWPIPSDATNAFAHIGTNAIPFLVKWVTYSPKPPGLAQRFLALLAHPSIYKVTEPLASRLARLLRDEDAASSDECAPVFAYLGLTALPPLLHLLDEQSPTNTIIVSRVENALGLYNTDEAVPFFVSYLTNSNSRDKPWVIHLLSDCPLTENASVAVNALVDCLTNSDVGIVGAASGGLCSPRRLGAQYTFVPFMTNRLAASQDQMLRSNIVVVLGQMGLHWTEAPVVAALNDTDPSVRTAATNAVQGWIHMVVNPSLQTHLSRYLQQ